MRFLVTLLLVILSSRSYAMVCFPPPLEERARDHSHVMLVEVMAARIEQSSSFETLPPMSDDDALERVVVTGELKQHEPRWRRIVTTVHVIETYNGSKPLTEFVVTSWGSPKVTVGAIYLVFADDPDVSADCAGMELITPSDSRQLEMLERLRALDPKK
jgi:hypothetical protein